MDFSKELENYMNILDCTAKKICDISGLSPALVCRYLGGQRKPKANSIYVEKLADALEKIADEKNVALSKHEIIQKLNSSIQSTHQIYYALSDNLHTLQVELGVSAIDLSRAIGYDPSFISRIKKGERKPADIDNFIKTLTDYTKSICNDNKRTLIYSLIGYNSNNSTQSCMQFEKCFYKWITNLHEKNS